MPHKHQPTLQGPYPCQQIKVCSKPGASISKKHGGMQHPRLIVPTKSEHPKYDRRYDPKRSISPPLTCRLLQGNEVSYKLIQT